jgi:hypothetical protein
MPEWLFAATGHLSPDQPLFQPTGWRAIVKGVNPAGVFLVVIGGALLALLVFGGRAGRNGAREIWRRMGLLRWVLVLVVIVIFLDLADGIPNR